MAECRLLTWQRIQHENNMTNTALQKYMPNSIRKIACQNVILSIWKTLQQIQLDKCTAKSESNTWQKRQHGKTSARQIHHNTKTWHIQHDKEKGRNMNLSHSKEPVQSSAYSGTHCVLDV